MTTPQDMSQNEYTKGPWFWCGNVLMANRQMHSETVHSCEFPEFTKEADKTLIASAPELLEALKLCQSVLATFLHPEAIKQTTVVYAFAAATEVEAKTRTVIAKAEGRQS